MRTRPRETVDNGQLPAGKDVMDASRPLQRSGSGSMTGNKHDYSHPCDRPRDRMRGRRQARHSRPWLLQAFSEAIASRPRYRDQHAR